MSRTIKTYSELVKLRTLEERFQYLRLDGVVGNPTFGSERYINQEFYRSTQWRNIRRQVIIRDLGCDLGVEGYDLNLRGHIHHINPMTPAEVISHHEAILDPEFLILVSIRTHNAIHFSDERLLPQEPVVRRPGDTLLWKRKES